MRVRGSGPGRVGLREGCIRTGGERGREPRGFRGPRHGVVVAGRRPGHIRRPQAGLPWLPRAGQPSGCLPARHRAGLGSPARGRSGGVPGVVAASPSAVVSDAPPEPEAGALAVFEAHLALIVDHDAGAAERASVRAVTLAREVGDGDLELLGLAYQGLALVSQGRIADGMPLLDEAVAAALAGEIQDPDAAASCTSATSTESSGSPAAQPAPGPPRHAGTSRTPPIAHSPSPTGFPDRSGSAYRTATTCVSTRMPGNRWLPSVSAGDSPDHGLQVPSPGGPPTRSCAAGRRDR
jgi:hypothetical protein